jgi:LEA14-like dessication related protein
MKLSRIYFFAIILLIASCADPKSFEFKGVKSVNIEKASIKKNILNAQLEYYNPNNFDLTLKKIDCDIFINDQKLTHYGLDTVLVIPSTANFIVPAKMEIELSNLLKHSVDIMFNKPLKITIVGNATLSKGIFTKTVPVNFTTVKSLNLKESVMREAMNTIQKQLNK